MNPTGFSWGLTKRAHSECSASFVEFKEKRQQIEFSFEIQMQDT